jgi:hypothetical protein
VRGGRISSHWPNTPPEPSGRPGRVARPGATARPASPAPSRAGLALDDPPRRRLAEDALAGCLADPRQLHRLEGASLCHGWAGLLQATWRVAGDCEDPDRFDMPTLLRHTADFLTYPPPAHDNLLTGLSGVRLAWHTVTAGADPASGWDACLLLHHRPATDPPPPTRRPGPPPGSARTPNIPRGRTT